ncbi:hypothetical protein [Gelidibacter gilvus]|uniref:Uncharacterized protein n=1 Tax=Gelidibacter gilvus TaxID=59602 RepID=A0A4Q0XLA0_9FLAO|nr:hypothetical protein [Gelidibacter gilvus]RXJ51109.1 hypothetical protein ESZ48_04325 [Gelidibacter gilvus]
MSEDVTHIRFSILGGAFTSFWMHVNSEDLIKTAVMATFGTVVSYVVSLLIKFIRKRIKRHQSED